VQIISKKSVNRGVEMAGKSAEKVDRIIRLLFYLSAKSPGGGATLTEIMEECGTSDRQVYRDINTLANCESLELIRPSRGAKEEGRYKIDEMLPLKIGPETAAMLVLGMLRQQGSPLGFGMENAKNISV
jgi:predicted DNA-binding transcriptional regulator YafY